MTPIGVGIRYCYLYCTARLCGYALSIARPVITSLKNTQLFFCSQDRVPPGLSSPRLLFEENENIFLNLIIFQAHILLFSVTIGDGELWSFNSGFKFSSLFI